MQNTFLKVDKELFNKGLNPTEILIMAQITEFINNTGECYMTDAQFAESFGVSVNTISRAIGKLEEKGLITRETKNIKGGKQRHLYLTNTKMGFDNHQNGTCTNTKMVIDKHQNGVIKDNVKDKKKIKEKKIENFSNKKFSSGAFTANAVKTPHKTTRKSGSITAQDLIVRSLESDSFVF